MTTEPARLAAKIQAGYENGGATSGPDYPDYNVAPTATVAAVVSRHSEPGDEPTRRVRLMRWGLVPPWVSAGPDGAPARGGPLLINARADRLHTAPAFRASVNHRRCLVPMDGFYEWRADPDPPAGKKPRKTPFFVYRADGEPLFAAGLWSVWRAGRQPDRRPLLSCVIVTTDAVGPLVRIHDRMPLLVGESDWDAWLDPDRPAPAELLAGPPELDGLALREVSTLVNNVANNGPELIAPAPDGLFSELPADRAGDAFSRRTSPR